MAFNSIDYVLFLVVIFGLFWRVVRLPNVRVLLLLLASYVFYTAWNGELVLLIIGSSALDYICGGLIYKSTNRIGRAAFLWTSLLINLGLLGYFKYTNFFIDNVSVALNAIGVNATASHLDIVLPIGISFYTFQSMSYSIDIYQGTLKPARTISDFFLFVAFFPQLIAGPIVRASEFLPQLEHPPELSRNQLTFAYYRLLRGFIKKMVIADFLSATMVDPLFQAPAGAGTVATFLGLCAFHFQVYCDFSGYTDIAIGSAALFGFKLPDNFATPYAAHTPANYWQRWHLTLSRFCFDYIYRPLGGNKHGELTTWFNTLVTFSVIGFWHGPNWNYVLFGVYHAFGVIGTRIVTELIGRTKNLKRKQYEASLAGRVWPIVITNLVIIGSLPLFRSPDMATAFVVYGELFNLTTFAVSFSGLSLLVLLAAIASHFVPIPWEDNLQQTLGSIHPVFQACIVFIIAATVLHMAGIAQQSFVYFQF